MVVRNDYQVGAVDGFYHLDVLRALQKSTDMTLLSASDQSCNGYSRQEDKMYL